MVNDEMVFAHMAEKKALDQSDIMFISSEDPVAYTRKKHEFSYGVEEHYHNVYEIYYLLNGSRKIFVKDTLYNLNKGDMMLIPKNTMHHVSHSSEKNFERICLRFTDECIKPFIDIFGAERFGEMMEIGVVNVPLNRRKDLENFMDSIGDCLKSKDEFTPLQIKNYMGLILVNFLRLKRASTFQVPQDLKGVDRVIQKAASYIVEHYKENVTLKDVADYVNMSDTYFSKKFKETTGFGFKEYLLALRIKSACDLLLNTGLSITEIAYKSGFNDSNYFGDVFKRIKGVSPLQYRKRQEYV